VLDLAAGSGVWGIALAQKSPLVTVTAVDWPGVLASPAKWQCAWVWPDSSHLWRRSGVGRFRARAQHRHARPHSAQRGRTARPRAAEEDLRRAGAGRHHRHRGVPGGRWTNGPPVALIFAVNMLINTMRAIRVVWRDCRLAARSRISRPADDRCAGSRAAHSGDQAVADGCVSCGGAGGASCPRPCGSPATLRILARSHDDSHTVFGSGDVDRAAGPPPHRPKDSRIVLDRGGATVVLEPYAPMSSALR